MTEAEAANTEVAKTEETVAPTYSPAVTKLLEERAGYTVEISRSQRKYAAGEDVPAPGDEKSQPQIYLGKLPRDMYEDELVPILEEFGTIYELRLMADNTLTNTKGYAFCTYTTAESATAAVAGLNGQTKKGQVLVVNKSSPNCRLFIGSIPKSKSKEQILEEAKTQLGPEVTDVIIYQDGTNPAENRGFAFIDFDSHKSAAECKKKLHAGKVKVFNILSPHVDWADAQEEPDEETMSKVKVVYVKNLPASVTEEKLKEMCVPHGEVESTKKLENKDYAFVHFTERDSALKAIEALNGQEVDGKKLDASLAKPQSAAKKDRIKKQKERQFLGGRGGAAGGRGGYGGDMPAGYVMMYVGDGGYGGAYDGYGYGGGYPPMRGRGGRGMPRGRPFGPPMRARGGPFGAMRGGPRGGRGGPRGMPAMRAGMKRPMAAGGPPAKRSWEAAPIPQKPLNQQWGAGGYDYGADYGTGYADYSGGDWYQQQW